MRMVLDENKIIIDDLEFQFSSHEAALITYLTIVENDTFVHRC